MAMIHQGELCDRIRRTDPETGVDIMQLTSFPLTHHLAGAAGYGISRDGQTILLFEDAELKRNSPRDLYRVRPDGSGLAFVAAEARGAVVSRDGRFVWTGRSGAFLRIPLDGAGEPEEVARSEGHVDLSLWATTSDGRQVIGVGQRADRTFDLILLDVETASVRRVVRATYTMPPESCGKGRILASIAPIDEAGKPLMPFARYTFSHDGADFRLVPFRRSTNHYVALGATGDIVTTAAHPARAIDRATPGDVADRPLAEGAGFWHLAADRSGEWIVADTNWPDVGLQLVHAPSGRFRTICRTGASGGHPQWTHAHPSLAPDASYALYVSDATGYAQIYRAEIPQAFRDELRKD